LTFAVSVEWYSIEIDPLPTASQVSELVRVQFAVTFPLIETECVARNLEAEKAGVTNSARLITAAKRPAATRMCGTEKSER
jgi:hypothetical protein